MKFKLVLLNNYMAYDFDLSMGINPTAKSINFPVIEVFCNKILALRYQRKQQVINIELVVNKAFENAIRCRPFVYLRI